MRAGCQHFIWLKTLLADPRLRAMSALIGSLRATRGLARGMRCFGDRTGSVKFFDPQRGFGFIESEGEDFFVHYSNIEGGGFKSLADGEEVEFDIETNDSNGKKYCVRVTGVGGGPVKGTSRPTNEE
ncbi:unnamed protein product [Effrenium voratum]|nr:unnamed protein product [Effrenium voratum]